MILVSRSRSRRIVIAPDQLIALLLVVLQQLLGQKMMPTMVMTRPLHHQPLETGPALRRDLLLLVLQPQLVQVRTTTAQTAGQLNAVTAIKNALGPETVKATTLLMSPCLRLRMLVTTKVLQADLIALTFQFRQVSILIRQVLPFRTTTCIARTCTSQTTT